MTAIERGNCMHSVESTFVNNGVMGITAINGNNYGTVTGVTISGIPSPAARVDGVVYNNGVNLAYQSGVGLLER